MNGIYIYSSTVDNILINIKFLIGILNHIVTLAHFQFLHFHKIYLKTMRKTIHSAKLQHRQLRKYQPWYACYISAKIFIFECVLCVVFNIFFLQPTGSSIFHNLFSVKQVSTNKRSFVRYRYFFANIFCLFYRVVVHFVF